MRNPDWSLSHGKFVLTCLLLDLDVSGQYCWLQASYFFNSSFWTLCSTRTTHCAVHFSHHYICSLGFLYLSLQTSNSCLAFLKVLWPEMSIWDFYGAVLSYQWSYKALEVRSLSYTMYSTLFGSIFKDWVRKLRVEFPKTWRLQVGFQVELTQDM